MKLDEEDIRNLLDMKLKLWFPHLYKSSKFEEATRKFINDVAEIMSNDQAN